MSKLEIIFTLLVWSLVVVVFCYYRAQALKEQWEQDAANRRADRARDEVQP